MLDYQSAAKMPFGLILREMVALESRGLAGVSSTALDDAVTIQRELIVLDLFVQDIEIGGPLKDLVREDKREKLSKMPIFRMIAPPGRALERFRREYLINPDIDLEAVLATAKEMQDANIVRNTVPMIGTIYSSAQTGLGRDGGAIINHFGLCGALMVQACCRCLLAPEDRSAFTTVRVHDTDPPALQEAQMLLNKLVEQQRRFTSAEGEKIGKWFGVATGWLFDAGFSNYAYTVMDFADDPMAPFRQTTLKDIKSQHTGVIR